LHGAKVLRKKANVIVGGAAAVGMSAFPPHGPCRLSSG
jgi:hypothetical protein